MTQKLVPELYCQDINTSREFYVGLLGFRLQFERPENKFIYLEREGAELMIQELSTAPPDDINTNMQAPFGRGVSFQIQTENVDQIYEKMRTAGCKMHTEMEEVWYRSDDKQLGNRQFWFQDPDGYLFRFFKDLGER